MNITISLNDQLVSSARQVARRQGMSLNALIRQCLEVLAGETPGHETADALLQLMHEHGGRSGGRRVQRDEAYEDRL